MFSEAVAVSNIRIMVAEDEDLVAMMLEEYLADLGCSVVGTAARLAEALQMARSLDIEMAVLDVNLAGEMSYPVAEALKARGIPVVFATGYGTTGLPEGLRGAPVLSKPYGVDQLAKALDAAKGMAS